MQMKSGKEVHPQAEDESKKERRVQPLDAAKNPAALLKVETVEALTGISRPTLYRWLAAGRFVQPIRLGNRCTRWRAGDVQAWLEAEACK